MVFLRSARRVCRASGLNFLPSRTFAGHNKWSKIKRKKAVNDAARNKLYTKILREIQFTLRGVDGDVTNSKAVQVLNKEKVVIIVCSSTGDGDPPDTCSKAWRFLRRQKTNLLEGVLYTILGRQKRRKELLFTSR